MNALIRRLALAASALVAAGCFAGLGNGPVVGGEVRRAALARVTVENRTDRPLDIAFRLPAEPGREVVVGSVAAGGVARMAPVLAGEPILLVARAEDGSEFRLPVRSFELGAEWVWVIPADAPFVQASTAESRP